MDDVEMEPDWMFWKKRRYIVAIFIFWGWFLSYSVGLTMTVAIIEMTNNRTLIDANGDVYYIQEFDWFPSEKGLVLSSIYYGMLTTQLLGGWLSMKISGKHLYGLGIGVPAILTMFMPLIAKLNIYALIALRLLEGIMQGGLYPSANAIWINWAPPLERTKLSTLSFSGIYLSLIIAIPICGIMTEKLGWPSSFYFFSSLSVIWYISWLVFISSNPKDDPWISNAELNYIQKSLAFIQTEKVHYPWRKMFCTPAVWAMIVLNSCNGWILTIRMNFFPTFLTEILKYDLGTSTLISALPYALLATLLIISGFMADWLRAQKFLTTTQVRKTFNTFSLVGQVILTACASWIVTTKLGIISCLTLSIGLSGISFSVMYVNYLDIAPNQSSMLMGFTNSISTVVSISSISFASYIIQNKTFEDWQTLFLISCILNSTAALIYIIYGSGEIQPWANKPESESNVR